MTRVIEFITNVMGRYSDSMESCLEDIGEITESIVDFIKYLLVGLFVFIGYILLAATMPVWYLPYKYFKRK